MKTRLVKFGAGAGIGAVVALIATAARRQEINAAAPVIDAFAGTGVEGQIGTAVMSFYNKFFRNANCSDRATPLLRLNERRDLRELWWRLTARGDHLPAAPGVIVIEGGR